MFIINSRYAIDKKYTGFEANVRLYQFRRIPVVVTNGVAIFQGQMDIIITEEQLKDTFHYVDDISVAGSTQEEHDYLLSRQHLTIITDLYRFYVR